MIIIKQISDEIGVTMKIKLPVTKFSSILDCNQITIDYKRKTVIDDKNINRENYI